MKFIFFAILNFSFLISNGQMSSFIKSNEFAKIKNEIASIDYYGWLNDIKEIDSADDITPNSFTIREEYGNNIFLYNEFAIFTYRFPAGTNCGTLVYNRKTKKIKKFPQICANKIYGQKLDVDRHWITLGKGHNFQYGILDLKTMSVVWKKDINRTY